MGRVEEELIAQMAAGQHGLVTRMQLLRAGISGRQLDRRVAVKRLLPVQRGVYQVGPLLAPKAREMAAVLACGSEAYASPERRGVVGDGAYPKGLDFASSSA